MAGVGEGGLSDGVVLCEISTRVKIGLCGEGAYLGEEIKLDLVTHNRGEVIRGVSQSILSNSDFESGCSNGSGRNGNEASECRSELHYDDLKKATNENRLKEIRVKEKGWKKARRKLFRIV